MNIECPDNVRKHHPWVCNHIMGLWGTKKCREYITDFALNHSNDSHEPMSFDFIIWINSITKQHDDQFPEFMNNTPFTFN